MPRAVRPCVADDGACSICVRLDRIRGCPTLDAGEMELVAGIAEAAQLHALEAVVGRQVYEAHLDALPSGAATQTCYWRFSADEVPASS